MPNVREEFEQSFPVPMDVTFTGRWYSPRFNDDGAIHKAFEYNRLWEGYQAGATRQSQQAQGEGEPVAWAVYSGENIRIWSSNSNYKALKAEFGESLVPLYRHAADPAAVPEEWREAVQEFVDRCEDGQIRSRYTYAKFKALLAGPYLADPEGGTPNV